MDTRMAGSLPAREDVRVGQRKKYTPEYRIEAARLVIDSDRTIAEVARELGIGEQLLGRWVRAERERTGATGEDEPLTVDERAELARLRREVSELKLDNEFLGKAAAFFASKQHRKNGTS